MKTNRFNLGQLFRMGAGLVVWSSAFVCLYAGFSLGCQYLTPSVDDGLANPVTYLLTGIFLVHLLALTGLGGLWWKRPVPAADGESPASRDFRHWIEGAVLAFSITGLVWIGFPIFMVAPCAG